MKVLRTILQDNEYFDDGHPYRWRTFFRTYTPWILIDLGLFDKGEDCEKVGGLHSWYNADNGKSGCYHCKVVKDGQLWKS